MSNTARMARQLKVVDDEWKSDAWNKAIDALAKHCEAEEAILQRAFEDLFDQVGKRGQ